LAISSANKKKILVLSDEKRLIRNAAAGSPVFACILFSIWNHFKFVHPATEIQGT
jgi:hypothetical protein